MRIKSLQIRNIASIEKADIDFENGLNAKESNGPASLFLITGDTGSGKTVILDCISMALFGTTPRVKSVANRSNNVFYGDDGNEIKIYDVSQYTRLGISSKDDCFSRLSFIGNDGVEYESTVSLGIARTGKYRPLAWRLVIGGKEVLEGNMKDEIKKRIVEAIGLNYEQFCRMAMLAQGQFANFLTGGKDERERILEQLTSTGHFSRYGEAIERIFKRTKQQKEETERLIAAEKKHVLSDEEEIKAKEELNRLKSEGENIRKEKEKISEIIQLISSLELSEKRVQKSREESVALEKLTTSEDFKLKKNKLSLWDATTEEREALKRKQEAEKNVGIFISYLHLLGVVINDEDLSKFIPSLHPLPPISEDFILSDKTASEIKKRMGQTAALEEDVKKTSKKTSEAYEKLNSLRLKLQTLYNDKDALKPEEVAKEWEKAQSLKNILHNLNSLISRGRELHEELNQKEVQCAAISKLYETAKIKSSEAIKEATTKRAELDKAKERFATMHLSVSENFNKLRARLASEHAEICPLCGNAKHWDDHLEDFDFSYLLSPLAEEMEKLSQLSLNADSLRDGKIKEESQLKGKLKAQTDYCKEVKEKISSIRRDFNKSANEIPSLLSSDSESHLSIEERISIMMDETEKQIIELSATLKKIENIQKAIDTALKETHPVEKEVNRLEKEKTEAETSYRLNLQRLNDLKNDSELNLKTAISDYKSASTSLKKFYERMGYEEKDLLSIIELSSDIPILRREVNDVLTRVASNSDALNAYEKESKGILKELMTKCKVENRDGLADIEELKIQKQGFEARLEENLLKTGQVSDRLRSNSENKQKVRMLQNQLEKHAERYIEWNNLNSYFGGSRFRTLVQSHILRPLLRNANVYLNRITDHFSLTCSEQNEQLSILVLDRYNKNQVRSATVLSGGERFMISLALSLALSAMNKAGMNVDILFIDEGFGTLDSRSLNAVMDTLHRLPEIAGQNGRRVGVISHREELAERIDVQIHVKKCGEGRSRIEITSL